MRMMVYVGDLEIDFPGVQFGALIARSLNAELTLLHVLPKKYKGDNGEKLLRETAEKLTGLSVHTRVRRGNVGKKILAEVKEKKLDFVVVSASRLGDYSKKLSVNREILPQMPCCVVVVKNPKEDIKRILMLTGGLQTSESMINIGAKFASVLSAQVTLMHVVANVPSMYTGLETIEETLEELLQTNTPVSNHLRRCAQILDKNNVPSKIMLKHGEPVYEIIRETDRQDYDLVIIGASGASAGIREWFFGNVTRDVLDLIGIPVMVVNQAHARAIKEITR